MSDERLTIRPATTDDLDLIVSLTTATRQQLAQWAPVYFNPAAEADDLHAAFLGFMVESDDHVTQAIVADDLMVGFFVENTLAEESRTWVDDLSVVDQSWWPTVAAAVSEAVASPWVTCASSEDTKRAKALEQCGLSVISSYWSRTTQDITPAEPSAFDVVDFDASNAAPHTFGGRAFRPELPGALVVGSDLGYSIGSPSTTPPIYNPGGPTTVVDQVVGSGRSDVLQIALAAAADRGDAQVVVVCGHQDAELATIVDKAGFGRVVDLIGS